jgi:hypothetical protein
MDVVLARGWQQLGLILDPKQYPGCGKAVILTTDLTAPLSSGQTD